MTDDIKLHPEHGLNPTIAECFWCGKAKNEIALLGAAYDGAAPMQAVVDYTPCPECEAKFAQGVAIFEATDDAVPTGRYIVLRDDAVRRVFRGNSSDRMLEKRRAFASPEVFGMLTRGLDEVPTLQ